MQKAIIRSLLELPLPPLLIMNNCNFPATSNKNTRRPIEIITNNSKLSFVSSLDIEWNWTIRFSLRKINTFFFFFFLRYYRSNVCRCPRCQFFQMRRTIEWNLTLIFFYPFPLFLRLFYLFESQLNLQNSSLQIKASGLGSMLLILMATILKLLLFEI